MASPKKKVWIAAKDVRARYAGVSEMTLWRWSRDPEMGFPSPVYINTRRFWDEALLDEFDAKIVRASMVDRKGEDKPARTPKQRVAA